MEHIDISMEFRRPVSELFALLSDHEKLGPILGAKIRRTKDGQGGVNGLGSVRTLNLGPLPGFDETVTAFEQDRRIEYRITRGSPLKNHKGVMEFSSTANGGSRLHYTIQFESKIPLVGPVIRTGLEQTIRRGLKRLR
ncbi:MAG: SRPBCC family protein [Deltaproteobacteria bacterium]|nr:SRPBCC family protein [Deltaproteobacteria bacterium]